MEFIKPNGKVKEKEVSCFRWMRSYHRMAMDNRIVAEVTGDELQKDCLILTTGTEPKFPNDPKNKGRKKFAKEVPIPKFPTIEEAFPEEIMATRTMQNMNKRKAGAKIFREAIRE